MKRTARNLFGIAVALAALAGGVRWWSQSRARPQFHVTADQNVLLITIDTLRADALGVYGGRAATPNLDRLASEGIRFTLAHTHAVVTLPSHSSIMTGRYPFEHGVRDNAGFRLQDDSDTLAEILERNGFATGAFVGAFPLDRQFGLAQGFDVYDDVGGREVAQGDFRFTERRAEEVVAAATQWIDRQPAKWFTWVHVFDPHSSYTPPPPFDAQYASDPYAGEVAYVDKALAPLLERARRGGRPTTVVVTADHGEGLGEHGEATHGVFAYESTLRVPLIVAQLGGGAEPRTAGVISNQPVRHIDLLPTVTQLLGLDAPKGLAGRSVVLQDRDPKEATYFEAMTPMIARGWAPLSGVIIGREKYVELPIEEFYDLTSDPGEQQNIVAKRSDRARELAAELRRFSADLPGEARAETAEVRERLRALGYVSGSSPRKQTYTEADDPKNLIDVDRLLMEGIEQNRFGRHREAIDTYRRVIERRPDMALAYLRLAFVQWDAGMPKDAIATLREGLKRLGPDVELEVRLGTYLAETGSAEAVPMLEKVTAARPDHGEALNALGIAYARADDRHRALQSFQRALQVNPRDVIALENLGTAHLWFKPEPHTPPEQTAGYWFERALQHDPRSSRAHAGLGVLAQRRGDPGAAIQHWRKAVEFDRSNFDALFNLATELAANGRESEARPYIQDFVQRAPAAFYSREIAMFRQYLAR
jgi:arylsulfatase A-like enzyme/Flp pilus assembly protein TadD